MPKKAKTQSPFRGRWRITSLQVLSQDVVDAEVKGFIEFGPNGLGRFQFAHVSGDIDYQDSTRGGKRSAEWAWTGIDEGGPAKGSGWAVIDGDEIRGVLTSHHGAQSEFEALRKGQKGSKKRAIQKPIGKDTKSKRLHAKASALEINATLAFMDAAEREARNKTVKPFPLEDDERATVAALPALPATLKKKLEKKAALTVEDVVTVVFKISGSYANAEPGKQKALLEIAQKLVDGLKEKIVKPRSARKPKRATPPRTTYQFKVTLLDIQPKIWRRIQVPDCTLRDLHEYIQAAFGWENYHLHQFEIDGVRYSQPAQDGADFDIDFEDETGILLSKLLPKSSGKARWLYKYDFGDGWRHEILFEGFPPLDPTAKAPLCLQGERACPPEDCGGPWGYGDFLAALADPENERHEALLEWCGPFDPEAFDATKATKAMRKVK